MRGAIEIETDARPDGPPPCIRATRSAVLNVLIGVAATIAVGGVVLGRREGPATDWSPTRSAPIAHGAVIGLAAASLAARRILGRRSRLRDPATRCRRFRGACVASAAIGGLAAPIGAAYGYAVRPRIDAVGPFWVAALALGFLNVPRGQAPEGLDEARR